MGGYAPDRTNRRMSGLLAGLLALGLLLVLPVSSPALAAARPPEGRAGSERASERGELTERRAARDRRHAIRREYLENLPPERRRELRQRVRERRRDRHWLGEAPAGERRRSRAEQRADRRGRATDEPFHNAEKTRDRRYGGDLRERLRQLRPEERRVLRRRLRALRELPEAERRRLHERYRALWERPPEERERLRENSRRWRAMSTELRSELREKQRRLRALPPEQRLQLLEDLLGP